MLSRSLSFIAVLVKINTLASSGFSGVLAWSLRIYGQQFILVGIIPLKMQHLLLVTTIHYQCTITTAKICCFCFTHEQMILTKSITVVSLLMEIHFFLLFHYFKAFVNPVFHNPQSPFKFTVSTVTHKGLNMAFFCSLQEDGSLLVNTSEHNHLNTKAA